MRKIVILSLGLLFFLFSCQREQKNVTQRIEVDLSHIDTVKISASRMINLETVDSSLLYDICALFKQETVTLYGQEIMLMFLMIRVIFFLIYHVKGRGLVSI